MSITDSLNGAASAVRDLLAAEDLSNAVLVVAQDVGQTDLVILQSSVEIPLQTNMLILVDVANANAAPTPILRLPRGQQMYITTSTGAQVAAGAVAGKCLFAISSANNGFYARLLVSPNVVPALASGPGFKNNGGQGRLDLISVPPITTISDLDYLAMLSQQNEGNNTQGGGTTWIVNAQTVGDYVRQYLQRSGYSLTPTPPPISGPGVDVTNNQTSMNVATLAEYGAPPPIDTTFFPFSFQGQDNQQHTARVSLARMVTSVLAQETQPLNFQQWTLPSNQNIPNATSTNVSFSGFSAPFVVGDVNGISFSQGGFYTIDIQFSIQIATTRNDSGGSASQARTYCSVQGMLNGTQIFNGSQANTSNNYVSITAFSASFTRYFAANDRVVFTVYGTGDSFQSGGVTLISPTTLNITRL